MSNFTNSPLVTYTRISPNKNSPRTEDKITKIIVHHMAGVGSVESFGEIVSKSSRQMSANYAIGNDGRIGMYCEEKDRCWCSSSRWADNHGIAIEVSNSKVAEPWPVSTKAWNSLVELCADICKRNGIPKMTYTGDTNGVLMFHRWFAATGCVPIDTTDVLTQHGWVPIRDVKIGDTIACVNPTDMTIYFDSIENMTPVHKDTVFNVRGMSVTKEHRVLFKNIVEAGMGRPGYQFNEYAVICDKEFTVPSAGSCLRPGLNMTSSEMVFLLEAQRVGVVNEETKSIEFTYIMPSKVGYFDTLVKNIGYMHTRTQEDLGPVKFVINDSRAFELCQTYLSGRDFNWNWLNMNPTQFSYFIYKITNHVDKSWKRKFISDSMVNIDVVQAICALNDRGTKYDPKTHELYVSEPYRTINPKETTTTEDVDVACVTVKSGCFLMRQNGVTTITGNCPGEYLFSRAQRLCDEVNEKLNDQPQPAPTPEPPPVPVEIKVDTLVSIQKGVCYYGTTKPIPDWVTSQNWYVRSINGDRVVLGKNETGNSDINSPVDIKYLTPVENAGKKMTKPFTPYVKRIEAHTPIYGKNNDNQMIRSGFIQYTSGYTIVEENTIEGKKYGKLKSGIGWVLLGNDSTVKDTTINPGDTVSVIEPKTYDGSPFNVYEKSYKVLRVNGDRVVISSDGVNVTAAVKASNLNKI